MDLEEILMIRTEVIWLSMGPDGNSYEHSLTFEFKRNWNI
jgi:hypothetical protein